MRDTPLPRSTRDLDSPAEIAEMVRRFYADVAMDDLLGPTFEDVDRVDWSEHLPKMYAFWEAVLFGVPGFKGNPMATHLALAQRTPLTSVEFDRWIGLFHETIDILFAGPMATEAKRRSVQIAMTMQHHLSMGHGVHLQVAGATGGRG